MPNGDTHTPDEPDHATVINDPDEDDTQALNRTLAQFYSAQLRGAQGHLDADEVTTGVYDGGETWVVSFEFSLDGGYPEMDLLQHLEPTRAEVESDPVRGE